MKNHRHLFKKMVYYHTPPKCRPLPSKNSPESNHLNRPNGNMAMTDNASIRWLIARIYSAPPRNKHTHSINKQSHFPTCHMQNSTKPPPSSLVCRAHDETNIFQIDGREALLLAHIYLLDVLVSSELEFETWYLYFTIRYGRKTRPIKMCSNGVKMQPRVDTNNESLEMHRNAYRRWCPDIKTWNALFL